MIHPYKTCDICWSLVEEHHLLDHKEWHKTLRNIPKGEGR